MPSSSSRARRSRAPSPEPQASPASDLIGKVAKGVLVYGIQHYLSRQPPSSKPKGTPSPSKSPDMPSKRSGDASEQSRAFGFSSSSNSRRDDPTHELISHLVKGAAALAARHLIKRKQKQKSKSAPGSKSKPPPPRQKDGFYAGPVPEHRPRRHRYRPHRPSRYPHPEPEIIVALDSLSAELARTTTNIRRMAGQRRPHRHRDGRCDVYEGLVASAKRLEGEADRVRTEVNNIRNLGREELGRYTRWGEGGYRRRGEDGGEWRGHDEMRGRSVAGGDGKSDTGWFRTRPVSGRAGSYVRTRVATEGPSGGAWKEREGRTKGDDFRGRRRGRSR